MLSGGDTSYLGACPKSSDSSVKVSQPKSSEKATPRAFELKSRYLRGFLRENIVNLKHDRQKTKAKTPFEFVYEKMKPYFGLNQLEIAEKIGKNINQDSIPKQIGNMISNKIVGKDKDLNKKYEIFDKTFFIKKNLPVNLNNSPLEKMSFRNLKLNEFNVNWEDSFWKKYFEEVSIILLLYQGTTGVKNGYRVLKDVKLISFNDEDIDSFEKTFIDFQTAIKKKNPEYIPRSGSGRILHIAPKAQGGSNSYDSFLENNQTKLAFYLHKDFIDRKIKESDDKYYK